MKIRLGLRLLSLSLPFALSVLLPVGLLQAKDSEVKTKHAGGALEFLLNTPSGDLTVYLPDDMASGDTISGSILTAPKGNTEAERAKNRETLQTYVVEIGGQKVPASKGIFDWMIPTPAKSSLLKIFSSGKEVANMAIPVSETRPATPPAKFQLPNLGQQWRLVQIEGPFDGTLSTTRLSWTASGNLSGEFERLAESPRKAVFRSPLNVSGPIQIQLKEGAAEAKGPFRNVAVRLSAPKTNLIKGETTTMTIKLEGLQGINEKFSLHLVKDGVVTMQGGDDQTISIQPGEIGNDGSFTLTRTMTGMQKGNWTATASVVPR